MLQQERHDTEHMTSDDLALIRLSNDDLFIRHPLWVDNIGREMLVSKITRNVWTTEIPYKIIGTKDFAHITWLGAADTDLVEHNIFDLESQTWEIVYKAPTREMEFWKFKLFVEIGCFRPVKVIENEY